MNTSLTRRQVIDESLRRSILEGLGPKDGANIVALVAQISKEGNHKTPTDEIERIGYYALLANRIMSKL